MGLFSKKKEEVIEQKEKKLTPFDFVTALNYSKERLLTDDNQSSYNQFLINKALSFSRDNIAFVDFVNRYQIDNQLHHDFLISAIRSRKRYDKWIKKTNDVLVDAISWYYKYSRRKALMASLVLTDKDKEYILNQYKSTTEK